MGLRMQQIRSKIAAEKILSRERLGGFGRNLAAWESFGRGSKCAWSEVTSGKPLDRSVTSRISRERLGGFRWKLVAIKSFGRGSKCAWLEKTSQISGERLGGFRWKLVAIMSFGWGQNEFVLSSLAPHGFWYADNIKSTVIRQGFEKRGKVARKPSWIWTPRPYASKATAIPIACL